MAKEKQKSEIDWKKAEETLFQLTIAELKGFGDEYKGEPFYGFAFDVNADYGDVLLCLNTERALEKSAQESAARPESDWSRKFREDLDKKTGTKSEPPKRESVDHYLKKLRWALGDWDYQGFESDTFRQGWCEFQEIVHDASIVASPDGDDLNPVSQRFLISVCKVMIRLEKEKAFELLPTTGNFKTWVGDHDEPDEWSIARLHAVRAGEKTALLKSWKGTHEIRI